MRDPRSQPNDHALHPGFTLISLGDYLERHMKVNPRDNKAEVARRLKWAAQEYLKGRRCDCGEPIWIIGSAVTGIACFACITGSANPDDDLELDVTKPLE